MSAFHAAVGGTLSALGVGMVMVARTWPAPGRHRARVMDDEALLTELLGPPSPYTTGFEHADGPISTGFADCPPCGRVTAGALTEDGWLCGECLTHTNHTTTGDHT